MFWTPAFAGVTLQVTFYEIIKDIITLNGEGIFVKMNSNVFSLPLFTF